MEDEWEVDVNFAEGGGIDPSEVELGGLLLKERAELVNFVAGLLQRGVQSCEIGPALQEYIEAKGWPPQGMRARLGIMQSAREMVGKAAAGVVEKKANEPAALQVVSLAEMEDEAVRWLWPGRIPLGKVTVICGESGLGKTCLALDLAARVSAGTDWPDEKQLSVDGCRLSVGESEGGKATRSLVGLVSSPCCASALPDSENRATEANRATGVERPDKGEKQSSSTREASATSLDAPTDNRQLTTDNGAGPGRVLLLNGEDHWGDSIRPRLAGGGANFQYITAITGIDSGSKNGKTGERCFECFELERDIPALRQQIEMLGEVRLVIIDSLEAYCGAVGKSSLRMRKVVGELVKLADECGVAVVVVSSASKCDLPVKHVWKVDGDVLDPELRLWLPVKFSSGRPPRGLGYRVTEKGIVWEERRWSPQPDWLRGSTAKQEHSWRLMEIVSWLKGYLGQGPCAAREVLDSGSAFGWTVHQVKRAKLALDLECYKETGKNGRWFWQLSRQPGSVGSRPSLDATLEWLDRAGRLDQTSAQQNKGSKECASG